MFFRRAMRAHYRVAARAARFARKSAFTRVFRRAMLGLRRGFTRPEGSGEFWKIVLPSARLAEFEGEVARRLRMKQVIAALVDHVDRAAGPGGASDVGEDRPQIDVDDDDAERLAVRGSNGCGHLQDRDMRRLDRAVLLVELDRRDVDFIRWPSERGLEVFPLAFRLELVVRNDADGAILSRAIHAHDLAPAVGDPDDAEFRIGGLGRELLRITLGHA